VELSAYFQEQTKAREYRYSKVRPCCKESMTITQERYEFIETLGTGATSRVDKARDTLIGRTVALKTFLHGFGSGDMQKQFLREAQIIGQLAHPYIVGLYDVGTNSDGVPYFVMEYVEGNSLERALDAGPLPLEKAALWATDLATAIARAHHAKVIHGDIKPANILITKDGQVKLADFGIARFATQVSTSGSLIGTPAYLSPEQILGHTQDTRSDLFSLGIILYQMTAGVRPFDGTSVSGVCAQIVAITPPPPSHHNPSLPPAFDQIVMRCLAKDPAQRYANAETLGASLYPFTHSKDREPAVSVAPLRPEQSVMWTTTVLKSLCDSVGLSRCLPQNLTAMRTSKTAWCGPLVQRKHLWAWSAAGLILMSLIPIARALRNHAPEQTVIASTLSTRDTSPVASSSATQTVITSSPSLINVSLPLEAYPAAVTTDSDSVEPNNFSAKSRENASKRPLMVTPAFERHPVSAPKPSPLRNLPVKPDPAVKSSLPVYTPEMLSSPPLAKNPEPVVAQTTLRIDIVSGVGDQSLAIYSGDDLLLTTQLQPAHLGDTLRFNCPIRPGEHALRVVLYRGDKTVYRQKENTSELRADGTNTMEVRVMRRSKMLLKHETSLEVVWPSSTAPSSANNLKFKAAVELALR
jgi:serine/threonine protein kinase